VRICTHAPCAKTPPHFRSYLRSLEALPCRSVLELSSGETTAAPDFLRLIEASSLSMLGCDSIFSGARLRSSPLTVGSVASWCTTCNFRNNHHATGTIAPRAGS
jgi:hypothetical protein